MIEASYKVDVKIKLMRNHLYFIPRYAEHRAACQAILADAYYEPQTHQLIKKLFEHVPGNLIHAGTFYGDMLPSFSDSVGTNGKIYAFEPVLENYVLAKQCIEGNNIENVILQNSGLSDKFDVAKIRRINSNGIHDGGASTISEDGDQIISLSTIDSLGLTQLTCLQLDIEGHELSALKGALKTISRCQPLILIEDNENNCETFLTDLHYENLGEIPGLKIWARRDNTRFREPLSDFID
jgi:FkbM family methyltransferase